MASTSGKNRSILSGLVGDPPPAGAAVTNTPKLERAAPPVGPAASAVRREGEGTLGSLTREPLQRLGSRLSTLARVTSGDIKEKTLQLVDPARCRMWEHHNRRYELLSPTACAELLEGLRSQGVQEFPAIVRRVRDNPEVDFEVICGARRHWAVSYLRDVEHREIKFLVEERELTDEAAFRLADIENRARQDISDYERAADYLFALDAYYGGVSRRMAERLEMSPAWLSRFLDLARLPDQIVAAFGDVRLLRANHARELKPLLEKSETRTRILSEAHDLARKQLAARANGYDHLDPARVVQLLKAAANGKPTGGEAAGQATAEREAPLLTATMRGRNKLVLELRLDSSASDEEFIEAFRAELAARRRR